MSNDELPLEQIRARVADLPINLYDGETTASARFEQAFSLESVAIAIGEQDCIYDKSAFPGVVYQSDSPPSTVVISGDGTIVAVDAVNQADAKEIISTVIDTLDDLGLIVDENIPEIKTNPQAVPFALEPPEVETLSYDDDP